MMSIIETEENVNEKKKISKQTGMVKSMLTSDIHVVNEYAPPPSSF
jgi:hypothetical protein